MLIELLLAKPGGPSRRNSTKAEATNSPRRERAKTRVIQSAFTLIELLVVVAIIGILMTILLPALKNAADASRRIACGNRTRQIAIGFLTYANDSEGWFPGNVHYIYANTIHKTDEDVDAMLKTYLSNPRDLLICPAARKGYSATSWAWDPVTNGGIQLSTTRANSHYQFMAARGTYPTGGAANELYGFPTPASTKDFPTVPIARLNFAGKTVMTAGGQPRYIGTGKDQPMIMDGCDPSDGIWRGSENRVVFYNNHKRGKNITFLDSHLEFRLLKDLQFRYREWYW